LEVIEIVKTLHAAMRHCHVEGSKHKIERAVLFFKLFLIFLILSMVDYCKDYENSPEKSVQNGKVVFIFTEMAS
jgi:hypothetical protein